VAQIRNSLRISRRLPVPVEAPLTAIEESESDESVVELEEEEEEEEVAEFPGIVFLPVLYFHLYQHFSSALFVI